MRVTQWIVATGVVIAAIWTGCMVETNTPTGTTSSSSSGSSSGSRCVGDGVGIFKLDCGMCGEAQCLVELSACDSDPLDKTCAATGCADCLTGTNTACTEANAPFVDAAYTCLLTKCENECFPTPPDLACGSDVSTFDDTPSGGACGENLGSCNPVTNSPCDTAGGFACDVDSPTTFTCYGPPNTADLCKPCDGATFCKPGTTCVDTSVGARCARFCCTNADCGAAGECLLPMQSPVGLCVPDSGMGGAGGMGGGGMGGAGGMGGGGMGGAGGTGGDGGGIDLDGGAPVDGSLDSGDGG